MTENKEELLERLGDLRALSKKKKYRLARLEHDEAVKTLSSICLLGVSGVETALDALPDFPSDTGAEAVDRNWAEISAHIEEFYRALKETKYNTELGKRLRLLIGRRLASKAPEVSVRVILDVFRDMAPAKKALPNSKDLNLINSTLLAQDMSILTKLPLDTGLPSNSVLLVSHCLSAGFSVDSRGKSLANPQTQLALIRWANGKPNFLNPGKEVQQLIAARVRDWNNYFLNLLISELDTLNPSLKDPIRGVLNELAVGRSQAGSVVETAPVPDQKVGHGEKADLPVPVQTETTQMSGVTYNVLNELERLTNHIKKMNLELAGGSDKVAELERRLRDTEEDMRAIRREKEEVSRCKSIADSELSESLARVKELEHSIKSHKDQVESLKLQLLAADNRHSETLESHSAHIDELSARIAKEGVHRLATFRNKLAGMLRPIAADLKGARSMEMTPELGIAMRTLLGQILNIMKSQGITIEGEDK